MSIIYTEAQVTFAGLETPPFIISYPDRAGLSQEIKTSLCLYDWVRNIQTIQSNWRIKGRRCDLDYLCSPIILLHLKQQVVNDGNRFKNTSQSRPDNDK